MLNESGEAVEGGVCQWPGLGVSQPSDRHLLGRIVGQTHNIVDGKSTSLFGPRVLFSGELSTLD